jgi:hypothetical protein
LRRHALPSHALEGLWLGIQTSFDRSDEATLRFFFAVLFIVLCHACAPMKKPLSRSAVREHLKPYAVEIGQASLAWNHLHENLRILFWFAIGPGPVPFAIWEKLSNDRAQRDMLLTAVNAGALKNEKMTNEVLWLLKQVDQLSQRRNSAIHAPLTTLTDTTTGITKVEPESWFGNRRAKSLVGKDIIQEIRWCAEWADDLNDFAAKLIPCMGASRQALPDRPSPPPPPNHSPAQTKR